MLQVTERYTPNGIAQMISGYKRQLKDLHEQRIATAHRKQDEHPRYMQMSEAEFKRYKIEAIRFNLHKAWEIEAKIQRLERMA
jgi:hypothetical protein